MGGAKAVKVLIIVAMVIVGAIFAFGWYKKRCARQAIEAVESSCGRATEHGGIDVARTKQWNAKEAIANLGYQDQPPYRAALNEAWDGCISWELDDLTGPLPPPNASHKIVHDYEIKREAARDAVFETPGEFYPYPDSLPPGWKNKWREPF